VDLFSAHVVTAILLAGVVPWSVQTFGGDGGDVFLRFAWGGVSFEPTLTVRLLWQYPLFAGPPVLIQWATAAGCWLLALGSAATGWLDAEDPRLTAGLLALAGFVNLLVTLDFSVQPTRTGYPVGTLAVWLVAAWRYWVHTRQSR
jgi:uncharacterized protein (TIGR04206 family)